MLVVVKFLAVVALLFSQYALATATTSEPSRDSLSFLPVLGSLTLVVGAILVMAYVVKKMNLGFPGSKAIKVVSGLSLGQKERIVVIEVNGQQHLLGVTPSQVNYLLSLDEPINIEAGTDSASGNSPMTFQKILQGVKNKNG